MKAYFSVNFVCPTSRIGRGIIKWCAMSVCPSVCLFVCPSICSSVCCIACRVPRFNSRTERPIGRPKLIARIGRMEALHMGNPRTYLEVKRSKVKDTRPINVVTLMSLTHRAMPSTTAVVFNALTTMWRPCWGRYGHYIFFLKISFLKRKSPKCVRQQNVAYLIFFMKGMMLTKNCSASFGFP